MLIDEVHSQLGWPEPRQILHPDGCGPAMYAELARQKIGAAIDRIPDSAGTEVGILSENPFSDTTEAPIAIVCNFPRAISERTLFETNLLAWNFCRSRLLITLEPHLLRVWSCWEQPSRHVQSKGNLVYQTGFDSSTNSFLSNRVLSILHWVELVSGSFFYRFQNRFDRNQRADRTLLSNLEALRNELKELALPDDTVHDLLARIIFVQFLMQRKDRSGRPALDENLLTRLFEQEVLERKYADLGSILKNKFDTYKLFRWLNRRFNGDLFPGKGGNDLDREDDWWAEIGLVERHHLEKLSEFVQGNLLMKNGQHSLWPLYSFDAIPLEFISSIYEHFVSESDDKESAVGAHYTPGYLVDFILDKVLPWSEETWDLKVLDPACGSGIFLVKAFQRLVYRWKTKNSGRRPPVKLLKNILSNNIFGIDVNPHAIRVASFSLYLAMCDEIDPRQYWEEITFPTLRGRSLVAVDFFCEGKKFVDQFGQDMEYDLIIGNAPWGRDSLTLDAEKWAKNGHWPVVNKQIGTLFLARCSSLIKTSGRISMLQPAGTILFNKSPTALAFRKKLFENISVEEIVDLSALRFVLFPKSSSPSCIVTLKGGGIDYNPILYYHPVPGGATEVDARLTIEPYDVHHVTYTEALNEPLIWTTLAWGSRRDLALIRRLTSNPSSTHYLTLRSLRSRPGWIGREGFKRGDRKKRKEYLSDGGHVIIESRNIKPFTVEGSLEINRDPYFHSRDSTNDSIFQGPLLLVSKSWNVKEGYKAAIYDGNAIFSASSVYGFRFPPEDRYLARAACAVINSAFSEWYFTLTSGRAAAYRPEVLSAELLSLPIALESLLERPEGLKTITDRDDEDLLATFAAREFLGLRDVEWAQIEEFVNLTLRDFRQPKRGAGKSKVSKDDLVLYCEYFVNVITSGFGRPLSATVFCDNTATNSNHLSIQIVGFHFDLPRREPISFADIGRHGDLLSMLMDMDNKYLANHDPRNGGIFYQRVARIYDEYTDLTTDRQIKSPSVFIVKPNRIRYWSRSAALKDADIVAADLVTWGRSRAMSQIS